MKSYIQNIKERENFFRKQRIRAFIFFILLELFFGFLIYRLFSLQCIQHDKYEGKYTAQQISSCNIMAKRGNIYDRNFQPLAVRIQSYSLYADPSNIKDWNLAAQYLSPILGMTEGDIIQKFKSSNYFVWLKRQLPDEMVNKIKLTGMKGLAFIEEGKRFYPRDGLAAHAIGFAGLDNKGLEGVEKAYEQYILGDSQAFKVKMDRMGRNLEPQRVDWDSITSGYDLLLTIDEVIQNIVEKSLKQACDKWQALGGSVIVMDPGTGEILALANYPTYDLNQASSSDEDHRRNRAIRDLYEPGSVFKVITGAAAINEKVFKPHDLIDCEGGTYAINTRIIHDVHSYDVLTFSEVIEKSSNIGITKIASRLGDKKMYHYIEAFGLNRKTGIDLSESLGYVRPLEKWTHYSMSSIPYGQELSITPLQMLCAINAIANQGIIMKPFIVRGVVEQNESLKSDALRIASINIGSQFMKPEFAVEFFPEQAKTPISRETARIMKDILVNVVEKGTAKEAKVDGYVVAGKTGTSQKASSKGGYMSGKYISSFAGFLPAQKPQISMIVIIDEPKGSYYGGTVACPIFREIATQVMEYMEVGQRYYVYGNKHTVEVP